MRYVDASGHETHSLFASDSRELYPRWWFKMYTVHISGASSVTTHISPEPDEYGSKSPSSRLYRSTTKNGASFQVHFDPFGVPVEKFSSPLPSPVQRATRQPCWSSYGDPDCFVSWPLWLHGGWLVQHVHVASSKP